MFAAVSAWAHSHGIRLLRSLDDWLVLASSEVEAKKNVKSALGLSHPQDRDKLGEVRAYPLADCELPRYDHRYRGRQDFSVPCGGQEISVGGGDVLYHVRYPRSALAGGFGYHSISSVQEELRWRREHVAGTPPSLVITWGTLRIGPSKPFTWLLWWQLMPWFNLGRSLGHTIPPRTRDWWMTPVFFFLQPTIDASLRCPCPKVGIHHLCFPCLL